MKWSGSLLLEEGIRVLIACLSFLLMLELHSASSYADGLNWKVATIPDNGQLQAILKLCGVLVIPDKQGGYEHNAAIYAADRQLRLTHIFDFNNTDHVSRKVVSLLEI